MKHFGELGFIRGIIYYTISPHEQKPFAGAIKYGIPNFVPRMWARAIYWMPQFVCTYLVYNFVEESHRLSLRKNPNDYLNEVDPNPPPPPEETKKEKKAVCKPKIEET